LIWQMPSSANDSEVSPPERLRSALRRRPPRLLASDVKAAVAVIIEPSGPQLLFIRRAEHPHDPWSGHIAFPGGKQDEGDRDLLATAQREAREEIGMDLTRADYLGQLDDLQTNISPLVVSGFAYSAPRQQPRLSEEVEDCFWVPLAHLSEAARRTHLTIEVRREVRRFPALSLGPEKPLLWGITYRFAEQVMKHLVVP
jgi:8-oxo-dGTP pyrophosphatase MutT (NUDIX family)